MIELNINDIKDTERHSSKGNQLKWNPANTETWYKADYIGYEGLTEYMVSHLLMHSTLSTKDFVLYDTEILRVGKKDYLGCKSSNFLPDGWQLLTLERLFHTLHGKSLYQSIFQFGEVEDRAQFLVDQVIQMTGLKDFGKYLCTLLTIDALFLNEDRHMHNIGVLLDPLGIYHYCPIFDNGCSLLSDTTTDYPLEEDIIDLIPQVQAKTLSMDFLEQLDAVEKLYGQKLHFDFNGQIIETLLREENFYSTDIKIRVRDILLQQRRSYQYLFS